MHVLLLSLSLFLILLFPYPYESYPFVSVLSNPFLQTCELFLLMQTMAAEASCTLGCQQFCQQILVRQFCFYSVHPYQPIFSLQPLKFCTNSLKTPRNLATSAPALGAQSGTMWWCSLQISLPVADHWRVRPEVLPVVDLRWARPLSVHSFYMLA